MTLLLFILVVVLLFGGGGYYGNRAGYGFFGGPFVWILGLIVILYLVLGSPVRY